MLDLWGVCLARRLRHVVFENGVLWYGGMISITWEFAPAWNLSLLPSLHPHQQDLTIPLFSFPSALSLTVAVSQCCRGIPQTWDFP